MTTTFRNTAMSLLGTLCLASLLGACTTQETNGAGGSGGGGGAAGGAAGGSTGMAGSDGTLCPLASRALISDFSDITGTEMRFGTGTSFTGGGYIYPTPPLKSDFSQGTWHISGEVNNYAGARLYYDNCDRIDASRFKGISFTVSGSVPAGPITFNLGTVKDTPTGVWMKDPGGNAEAKPNAAGRCLPASGNQYYHPGCTDFAKSINVTATPTPATILWADLAGGTPETTVTPSEITTMYWMFPWQDGATPYQLDLVMDDLSFIQ